MSQTTTKLWRLLIAVLGAGALFLGASVIAVTAQEDDQGDDPPTEEIGKSDKAESPNEEAPDDGDEEGDEADGAAEKSDAEENGGGAEGQEHPENHGAAVSAVAHEEHEDHGAAVCAVASEGKCKQKHREGS